jgi:putative acetyltransferase
VSTPPADAVATRPERPGDRQAILEIHRAAFGGDVEPKLVDALHDSGDAEISLVAVADGEVIGHVLFSRLDAPLRALALAPVAVAPERQRQGVGSDLIGAGLCTAKQAGWQAVFVLGEPAYYTRFGFDVDAAKSFDCPYAGDYFMALFFIDSPITHGAITYPRPFQAL